jgi:hypothetical protein
MPGCNDCTIRRMRIESCCTEDVGFGLKTLRNPLTKMAICVCSRLIKNEEGGWMCSDYYSRPSECKSFECDLSLGDRL